MTTKSLFIAFFDAIPNNDVVQNVVRTIADNDVVVISGETGCGKTTQVYSLTSIICQ